MRVTGFLTLLLIGFAAAAAHAHEHPGGRRLLHGSSDGDGPRGSRGPEGARPPRPAFAPGQARPPRPDNNGDQTLPDGVALPPKGARGSSDGAAAPFPAKGERRGLDEGNGDGALPPKAAGDFPDGFDGSAFPPEGALPDGFAFPPKGPWDPARGPKPEGLPPKAAMGPFPFPAKGERRGLDEGSTDGSDTGAEARPPRPDDGSVPDDAARPPKGAGFARGPRPDGLPPKAARDLSGAALPPKGSGRHLLHREQGNSNQQGGGSRGQREGNDVSDADWDDMLDCDDDDDSWGPAPGPARGPRSGPGGRHGGRPGDRHGDAPAPAPVATEPDFALRDTEEDGIDDDDWADMFAPGPGPMPDRHSPCRRRGKRGKGGRRGDAPAPAR